MKIVHWFSPDRRTEIHLRPTVTGKVELSVIVPRPDYLGNHIRWVWDVSERLRIVCQRIFGMDAEFVLWHDYVYDDANVDDTKVLGVSIQHPNSNQIEYRLLGYPHFDEGAEVNLVPTLLLEGGDDAPNSG